MLASAEVNTAEQGLITIQQFAVMTGLSVRQVRRLNAAGQAPGRVKHGRKLKYRRSEAEAWLARRKVCALTFRFAE
ncbi:helix-turn-helix transcriptional regulator [Methylobacterium oxalidis]